MRRSRCLLCSGRARHSRLERSRAVGRLMHRALEHVLRPQQYRHLLGLCLRHCLAVPPVQACQQLLALRLWHGPPGGSIVRSLHRGVERGGRGWVGGMRQQSRVGARRMGGLVLRVRLGGLGGSQRQVHRR